MGQRWLTIVLITLITLVLHVVFEQKGKECKVNVYGNEISI